MVKRLSLVFLLFLVFPIILSAQPIGKPYGGGDSYGWELLVSDYDSIVLTVSPPNGETYTKRVKAGYPVQFLLKELPGEDIEDGAYTWELALVPRLTSDFKKKLAETRVSGSDKDGRRLLREAGVANPVTQSGVFTVVRGYISSPNDSESDADEKLMGNVGTQSVSSSSSSRTRRVSHSDFSLPTDPAPASRPWQPETQDQCIPDDLIVMGSLCVGFDCVCNESFGFDTIRLKENNLRIKFEDTSTGTFPTNDWMLTANDSASGGASKFSIEDVTGAKVPFTVEAGATTNSIFVDSTGRVGFRSSTPVLDLHVNTSNTPGIRLEQNNSGGFTAQTWDVAGNEANFFVRDVTGGSKLSLRIRPGAPTSSLDISADGDIGMGTASPEANLHVFSSNTEDSIGGFGPNPDGSATDQSALNFGYAGASFGRAVGFFNVRPDSGATAPNPSLRFLTANTTRILIDNEGFIALGTLASTGGNPTSPIHYTNGANTALLTTGGVWQDASSRAAKENIVDLDAESAINALNELHPVRYNYKVAPEDAKVGFIAEDVPEIVATPERTGLSALDIVAVVTKVVQQQQKTIDELNQTIGTLNQRIDELEKAKQQQQ